MKKLSLLVLTLLATVDLFAQGLMLPKPSPSATLSQEVGITKIDISYCRPSAKGRKIFGDIVPFDQVWRTGANEATTITFSTDVNIGETLVKAGKYALFTIPNEKEWTLIINSDYDQWGSGNYSTEKDIVRIKVPVTEINHHELLTFVFTNVTETEASIAIEWEKTKVTLPIKINTKDEVSKSIEASLKEADGVWRTYTQTANYYLTNNEKLDEALALTDKAIATGIKHPYPTLVKSKLLAAKKDYKGAVKVAEESLKISSEIKSDYYKKQNEANIAEWSKKK